MQVIWNWAERKSDSLRDANISNIFHLQHFSHSMAFRINVQFCYFGFFMGFTPLGSGNIFALFADGRSLCFRTWPVCSLHMHQEDSASLRVNSKQIRTNCPCAIRCVRHSRKNQYKHTRIAQLKNGNLVRSIPIFLFRYLTSIHVFHPCQSSNVTQNSN